MSEQQYDKAKNVKLIIACYNLHTIACLQFIGTFNYIIIAYNYPKPKT